MRRWAVLLGGAAVWLFLLAVPAFADGGPHVATNNSATNSNGTGMTYSGANSNNVLTSDNCAGCHRAHTAQGYDITVQAAPALCITCHGGAGLGATTDVVDGIQYTTAAAGKFGGTSTVLGALRSGGFVNARLASSTPGRLQFPRYDTTAGAWSAGFSGTVPVASSGSSVTSKHMGISAAALKTVWGSGAMGVATGAGATMQLNCTSCHNPHGNNQYRILNPIPTSDEDLGTFVPPTTNAIVADGPVPNGTGIGENTRNYTTIQNGLTNSAGGTNTLLTVVDVTGIVGQNATMGDYFRRYVPWYRAATYSGGTWTGNLSNGSAGGKADNPVGLNYASTTSFGVQITAWCAQCHTRYHTSDITSGIAQQTDSGDSIFKFRHGTMKYDTGSGRISGTSCVVCHVAHGSNAQMTGTYSAAEVFPGQVQGTDTPYTTVTGVADSRLLKVDNRGTCQLCHDPTGTVPTGVPGGSPSNYTGTFTTTYSGPSTPNYPVP